MTSYLASLLFAVFAQLIAMSAAKLFGNWDLVKLLDPVGVAGIVGSEMANMDTNTRKIRGSLRWRECFSGIVSCGLGLPVGSCGSPTSASALPILLTDRWWSRFKKRQNVHAKPYEETARVGSTAISVPQVKRTFGFATYVCQTLTIAWASFGKIARHPVGLTLVGAIAMVSAVFGDLIMTEFGIPLLPTTQQVLGYLTAPVSSVNTPWVVIPLLIMYFVGELVWQ